MRSDAPGTRKHKRPPDVPDRQLAQAFSFSANDLAANRAGFVSAAQRWGIPPRWQQRLGWLIEALPNLGAQRVRMVCGRARLKYRQRQTTSMFRVDVDEFHSVLIDGKDLEFPLTAQQHRILTDGVMYYIYYGFDSNVIWSVERAFDDCERSH